jgi:hypothetical protein
MSTESNNQINMPAAIDHRTEMFHHNPAADASPPSVPSGSYGTMKVRVGVSATPPVLHIQTSSHECLA